MRIAQPPSDKTRLSEYASAMSGRFGRCLAPGTLCNSPPIRAHAVQNSRVLETLQRDGHVMMMSIGLADGGLDGALKEVSRNEATTFRGMCADHDSQIFELLDIGALDANDTDIQTLLSWRAITHELHQTIEAAGRMQTAYIKKVEAGELDGNTPSAIGIEATRWMFTAYETFEYRSEHWDAGLSDPSNAAVTHEAFEMTNVPAILAASGLFSFQIKKNHTPCRIALNIWPDDKGCTTVLFGFSNADKLHAKRFIRSLLDSKKNLHPAKLSAALLQYVGNFVLEPTHVKNWTEAKRESVESAFLGTITDERKVVASRITNLFI
jgi:hypothetical protein